MKADHYDTYLHCYITAHSGQHVDMRHINIIDGTSTDALAAGALAINDAAHGSPSTHAEFAAEHARMLETTEAASAAVTKAKAEAFDAAWRAAFAGAANSPDCHGSMTEALTNAAKALGVSLD